MLFDEIEKERKRAGLSIGKFIELIGSSTSNYYRILKRPDDEIDIGIISRCCTVLNLNFELTFAKNKEGEHVLEFDFKDASESSDKEWKTLKNKQMTFDTDIAYTGNIETMAERFCEANNLDPKVLLGRSLVKPYPEARAHFWNAGIQKWEFTNANMARVFKKDSSAVTLAIRRLKHKEQLSPIPERDGVATRLI